MTINPQKENERPDVFLRTSPDCLERILAGAMFFGVAAFTWFWLRKHDNKYPAHHARQADALFFVLFVLIILFAFVVAALSCLMVYDRAFYDAGHYEIWTLSVFRKLLIAWAVFWIYGFFAALLGSRAPIPFVGRLGGIPLLSAITRVGQLLVAFLLIVMVVIAAHGLSMVREPVRSSKACLLYEDVDGRFPRWLFAFGYYPTVRAAAAKWGDGNVALRRLTRESLLEARGKAEFLFVGSHGMDAGILLTSGFLKPGELRNAGPYPNLRFVYLAGCDSGSLKKEWEDVFAPAQVLTQEGLTPLLQHLWWLWFEGPSVIGGISESS